MRSQKNFATRTRSTTTSTTTILKIPLSLVVPTDEVKYKIIGSSYVRKG